tara:strand:+ start:272 stop:556 length:285 start_codon:yes stop_codon:yes gene_type:complete
VVHFLDPRADVAAAPEPYEAAADWSGGAPSIGLLANGFPDSVAFLAEVGEAIRRRLPGVELRSWDKGNASAPASDQLLDGIAAEVKADVAAYGH